MVGCWEKSIRGGSSSSSSKTISCLLVGWLAGCRLLVLLLCTTMMIVVRSFVQSPTLSLMHQQTRRRRRRRRCWFTFSGEIDLHTETNIAEVLLEREVLAKGRARDGKTGSKRRRSQFCVASVRQAGKQAGSPDGSLEPTYLQRLSSSACSCIYV